MARSTEISQPIRQLIIKQHLDGKSGREIAKTLYLAKTSVQNIINKYKRNGNTDVEHRSGRPKIYLPHDCRKLREIVHSNRFQTAKEVAFVWSKSIMKNVSVSTTIRTLKKIDLGFYKVSYGNKMLLTEENSNARFCLCH